MQLLSRLRQKKNQVCISGFMLTFQMHNSDFDQGFNNHLISDCTMEMPSLKRGKSISESCY